MFKNEKCRKIGARGFHRKRKSKATFATMWCQKTWQLLDFKVKYSFVYLLTTQNTWVKVVTQLTNWLDCPRIFFLLMFQSNFPVLSHMIFLGRCTEIQKYARHELTLYARLCISSGATCGFKSTLKCNAWCLFDDLLIWNIASSLFILLFE